MNISDEQSYLVILDWDSMNYYTDNIKLLR